MHILSTKQYGLGIGLKIDNAINKITNEILNVTINVPLVGRILWYLKKVFQCVDHGIPLSEFEFCGINGMDLAF